LNSLLAFRRAIGIDRGSRKLLGTTDNPHQERQLMHHESDCRIAGQCRRALMIGFGAGFLTGGDYGVSNAGWITGTGLNGQGIGKSAGGAVMVGCSFSGYIHCPKDMPFRYKEQGFLDWKYAIVVWGEA
jgi:hypothetical protein